MNDTLEQKLGRLRALNESGLLPDAVYHAQVEQALAQAQLTFAVPPEKPAAQIDGESNVTAVEQSVAVGGDIQGNVYIGVEPTNDAEALAIYRRVTAHLHGRLPLRGRDVGASDPAATRNPLQLTHIYIALNTTQQQQADLTHDRSTQGELVELTRLERGQERPPLSALAATSENRRLVLTGDPGSGKSTFANYLTHCCAMWPEWKPAERSERLAEWDADGIIPIFVTLRDFAHALPDPLPETALPRHLWAFIIERLSARNLGFVVEPLHALLEQGQAIVLLDGLDEVAYEARRRFVRDAVAVFAQRYPDSRILVTCRTLSYQPPATELAPDLRLASEQFPTFTLAPFNDDQISRFVEAWYADLVVHGELTHEAAAEQTHNLKTAIARADLSHLARTPLLLTVMALVHTHRGRLPDARSLLYEETVEMLLWRWEELRNAAGQRVPTVRQRLHAVGRKETDFLRILRHLAFEAHSAGSQQRSADISEWTLQQALAVLNEGKRDWAAELIQMMKLRTGLLVEREPSVFSFPHRTYQEYLAGCHLSVQAGFAAEATELINADRPLWREVVLLAVVRLVNLGDIDKPLALVGTLCPRQAVTDEAGWYRVWFAGEVLVEIGQYQVEQSPLGRDLLAHVRERLVALLAGAQLPAQERVLAGDTLALLGDPRPGVCTLEPDLIAIPAGSFLMGEDDLYAIELPAFAIARYPVTNAQYRLFVEDGGYRDKWRPCWTEEGWGYKESSGWTQPRYWDRPDLAHDNQPVVGVSWYEAVAYAGWLRATTGKPYRLPTEAEWERAARHTDGRVFTWESEQWQDSVVNSSELGLKRTSAVGAFPQSVAVCGAYDMLGNVWEWCQTRWQDEQEKEYPLPYRVDDGREDIGGGWRAYRVLRGGSAWNDKGASRCGIRLRDTPNNGNYNIGFRIAVSPLISGL